MPKFISRQRKHKVLRRAKKNGEQPGGPADGANALEIVPLPKAEREQRRQALNDELRSQLPKISDKKKKRLEKYVESKLKKEENLGFIKKLAATKVDTSLFRSSKTLGTVKESKKDQLSRALKETQAGIDVKENEKLIFEERPKDDDNSDDEDDARPENTVPDAPLGLSTKSVASQTPIIGLGLKRPLEQDGEGKPVLKKKKKQTRWQLEDLPVGEEPKWEGFGSDTEPQSDSNGSLEESRSREGSVDISNSTSSHSENDTEDLEQAKEAGRARSSTFKAWATQKLNEALDYTPAGVSMGVATKTDTMQSVAFTRKESEQDPLPLELQVKSSGNSERTAYSVVVTRPLEVQKARLGLPVVGEEQKIMEAIYNNSTVIIWGATGSGKTTQVPQFLFEAGYGTAESPAPGLIGITQPRRVAAVSMAKRVGDELGEHKEKVSYQIRFEGNVSSRTAIKFMTDGVLLREIAQDITLKKYSVVIIDEAHERSLNTDILIGMMSRIVRLRKELSMEDSTIVPLKLVIMSATLRTTDFTNNRVLFSLPPPIIQAEGRQYPVSIHFARRTNRDYVEDMYQKISRGHRKLPPGGMLIFLTGQNEITNLSKRLKALHATKGGLYYQEGPSVCISGREAPTELEDLELGGFDGMEERNNDSNPNLEIQGHDSEDDEDDGFDIGDSMEATAPMHILPLYSLLPTRDQLRVFEAPPRGTRLVVLATNVAETSLTIPGIRYVFDCGRVKERQINRVTGVQSFEIGWISKTSASQRAGRAGRTGPGHCYRLYSSAVFERDFQEFTEPEIQRTPIEGVVLQLKSMNLSNVMNFPFPTPPDRESLAQAERLLSYLGALDTDRRITNLGVRMSTFPLSPRFSRMLLVGHQHGCILYTISLVAALSVSHIFVPEHQLDFASVAQESEESVGKDKGCAEDVRMICRKAYGNAHYRFAQALDARCDALKILAAVLAYCESGETAAFCKDNFLRSKALREVQLLRRQVTDILTVNSETIIKISPFESKLPQPGAIQVKALKQILAAGFIDQVAIRADVAPIPPLGLRNPQRAIDVPYITLFPSHLHEEDGAKVVYIHPSSVLSYVGAKDMPQYIIYSYLQRSSSSSISSKAPRVRMHPLTPIGGVQLTALAHGTPLLTYSKPIKDVMPKLVEGKEDRRQCWVIPYLQGPPGMMGWPLPAKNVVQRKERGKGWVVDGG